MATSGGPNVNRDGLVLFLDTPTNRSFRGEPTVNVINGGANRATVADFPISTGRHASISRTVTLTSYSSDRPNVLRYTSTNNTGYSMLNQQFSIQNQSGTTYTYSFEYKQLAGPSNSLQYSVVYKNGYKSPDNGTAASSISNTQIDLEDGWKRWILTYTSTYTGYNHVRFNLFTGGHLGTQDGDFDFYFDNFMLQEGSKRTRFVDGTRGTTVATGGGWKDMSGNNNHGELVNGVTTDSDSTLQHSLDFDGTNDYIDLGTQFNSLTTFAVEGVFKTDITGGADTYQNIWGAGTINSTADYTGISIGNFTGGYNNESFHVTINDTTYQAFVRNGAGFYFDGNYHHFVVNIEPGNNTIYIDGEQQSITYRYGNINTDTGGLNGITNNNTYVGRRTYPNSEGYFNGKIPLIRMYDRGLTQQEVLENYKAIKSRYGL